MPLIKYFISLVYYSLELIIITRNGNFFPFAISNVRCVCVCVLVRRDTNDFTPLYYNFNECITQRMVKVLQTFVEQSSSSEETMACARFSFFQRVSSLETSCALWMKRNSRTKNKKMYKRNRKKITQQTASPGENNSTSNYVWQFSFKFFRDRFGFSGFTNS